MGLFDKLATTEPVDSGRSKPEHGSYLVEITDCLVKGDALLFIAEYKVIENGGVGSPVGFTSSYTRNRTSQGWMGYFTSWLYKAMGQDGSNPTVRAQLGPLLPAIVDAACTKVVQTVGDKQIPPTALIGRKLRLTVSQGKTDDKGKYWPREDWATA
jgi:hypothetical protein